MKTMTTNRNTMLAVLCALLLGAANAPAQFNLLHSFAGAPSDGMSPFGALTLSGSTLYGMTALGGSLNSGTAFKMNTDGTGFTLLHSFTSGGSDGSIPFGSLTVSGSTLYGMATHGGVGNGGTVFKMNTDGTGFTTLRSFAGGGGDGDTPNGSLTLDGSTLYGMTAGGGTSGRGTVFQMNTDGTGFTLLHSFTGGGSDGMSPFGALTLSGSTLYGMTYGGGTNDLGTVFKMNTDGDGFNLLHSFAGGVSDGSRPFGSLTLSGSTLYGMTYEGGVSDAGTAFQMNTDGTGFALLHSFNGGVSDGSHPSGSLTLDGSTLYGTTRFGGTIDGTNGFGTAFQMNTNGTGFALLHSFTGDVTDGACPYDSLTLDGSKLYGMTYYGGGSGLGTVFSIGVVPEPSSMGLVLLGLGLIGWRRLRFRRES
jgi:uncharacterized repeat protein (TIGR03803 family)